MARPYRLILKFSTVVLNPGQFAPPGTVGSVWRRFWLSQLVVRKEVCVPLAPSSWRPERLPYILQYRTFPHNKEFPGPNVNSAELRYGGISKSPLLLVLSPLQTRAWFTADNLSDVSGPFPLEGLCKCIAPTGRLTGQCQREQVLGSTSNGEKEEKQCRQQVARHSVECRFSHLRHLCSPPINSLLELKEHHGSPDV